MNAAQQHSLVTFFFCYNTFYNRNVFKIFSIRKKCTQWQNQETIFVLLDFLILFSLLVYFLTGTTCTRA